MKLVVDTTNRRVLFAEASKEAVDYLHSLLPSVSFESLTQAGCVANLYDSVEQLDAAARAITTKLLFQPAPPSAAGQQEEANKRFFECGYKKHGANKNCALYVAGERGAVCPSCGREMAAEVPRGSAGAGSPSGEDAMMCLLKDDLTVMPVPASKLALARCTALYVLTSGAVVSAAALHERTVLMGHKEGLAILKASLESSTALTRVFLGRRG
ncbi:hypothetical protein QOZ80_1AG0010090 [Eleusine coracana subsp. coracana]|nr:hypothetical protein QOZ80_1AG0010090 [Eleusine coracana subsp. coracana]